MFGTLLILTGCSPQEDFISLEPYGNTGQNILSVGWVVSYADTNYYVDWDNHTLISKGRETNNVLSDEVCGQLNIIDDWIYYINNTRGQIWRISIDGDYKEQVIDGLNDNMLVCGDYIFYRDKNANLIQYNIQTTKKKKLVDSVLRFVIQDNIIYYTLQEERDVKASLYSLDLKEKETKCLYEGYVWDLAVNEKYLLFQVYEENLNQLELHQLEISTNKQLSISNTNCAGILLYGDTVFYVNSDDGFSLYKMNIDGTEVEKIVTGQCSTPNISGNKLFFLRQTDKYEYYWITLDDQNLTPNILT